MGVESKRDLKTRHARLEPALWHAAGQAIVLTPCTSRASRPPGPSPSLCLRNHFCRTACEHRRCLRERLRQRSIFAVRPIADSPLVMIFEERESRGFHRILVLTPSHPELLSWRRLAHIGRSWACLYPLGFSKVQSVHCSVPNFCIAGREGPILQRTGVRSKSEDSEVAGLAAGHRTASGYHRPGSAPQRKVCRDHGLQPDDPETQDSPSLQSPRGAGPLAGCPRRHYPSGTVRPRSGDPETGTAEIRLRIWPDSFVAVTAVGRDLHCLWPPFPFTRFCLPATLPRRAGLARQRVHDQICTPDYDCLRNSLYLI